MLLSKLWQIVSCPVRDAFNNFSVAQIDADLRTLEEERLSAEQGIRPARLHIGASFLMSMPFIEEERVLDPAQQAAFLQQLAAERAALEDRRAQLFTCAPGVH